MFLTNIKTVIETEKKMKQIILSTDMFLSTELIYVMQ